MNWFSKYLVLKNDSGESPPEKVQVQFHFRILLLAGMGISLLLMVYKELFRTDLSSPIAETATLLMFIAAYFLTARKNYQTALGMVFFIPLLIYLYYLSSFGNNAPPRETILYSCTWLVTGSVILAAFSPFNRRYTLYYITGMITLFFHALSGGLLPQYLSIDQVFILNPFLILTAVFMTIALIRKAFDKHISRVTTLKEELDQQWLTLFEEARYPLVQIRTLRDSGGNILRLEIGKVNRAFESVFKIKAQEARSQDVKTLFDLVFRDNTNWNDLFIIQPKVFTECFHAMLERWFNLHLIWVGRDKCICLFFDITREKNLVRSLTDARSRYLALLEAIPDIFFVIDRDGIYQDVVFKGQENLYPETSEVIGNTIFNVGFSRVMAQKIHSCILKAIENDTIETIEYTLDTPKAPLFFEMRLAKLDENSVISIARDITRRKKAEFELEKAKTRAEDAVALKARFLANLSHDIRTPMNAILGLTKILSEPAISEDDREELVRDVETQGTILLQMIENTIQLSKIETNTLDVNFSFTNVNKLLRELYNRFYAALPASLPIRLTFLPGIIHEDAGFETDPSLLYEILFRLIDNAVKYTRSGMVHFGYAVAPGNMAEFFVEDTGPGIPVSEKENIFLRFYVMESDRKANRCGPGLGLPVAQHFTALLGGELKVDSTPGKGSRFWFRLPLKNPRGFMQVVQ